MPNDGSGRSDGDHKMVDCNQACGGVARYPGTAGRLKLMFVVKQRVGRADEVIK
jgi:hypothetical protein